MTGAEARPPTRLAALLLDAYEAVLVTARQLPAPGQGGSIGRLSPGGWVIGHLADQQDRAWNTGAQSLDADPWLVEHGPFALAQSRRRPCSRRRSRRWSA